MECATLPVPIADARQRRLAWRAIDATVWLVGAGLLLRLGHYLWNHTIWYDEAVLLTNVLSKDYYRLLGPLDYEVAAPPLFLWTLRTMAVVFGDHPYVWRLPPFLIGCVLQVLMAMLARRVLRPGPAALLVCLVAFSDAYIWLGLTVKPYVLDALLAAAILYFYIRTDHWTPTLRVAILGTAAPVLLCVSYPMLFMYASVLLAFLPIVWRSRAVGPWSAYLGVATIVVVTFTLLYLGPIEAQRVSGLVAGWNNKFPDLTHPAAVPGWVIGNTFLVLHYCYNPVGAGLVFLIGPGIWWCVRNQRVDWICLCLGPVALCLLAAFKHAYPYSGNRLVFFMAPGIGLMTGLGMSAVMDQWRHHARRTFAGLAILLILPEIGLCAMRIAQGGWDRPNSAASAQFIRHHRQPGDLIADDEGTYSYFFFGETTTMADVNRTARVGQRVWVVVDHRGPEYRRQLATAGMPTATWNLELETLFEQVSVFMFVRQTPHSP